MKVGGQGRGLSRVEERLVSSVSRFGRLAEAWFVLSPDLVATMGGATPKAKARQEWQTVSMAHDEAASRDVLRAESTFQNVF